MVPIPIRRLIVRFYKSGLTGSYGDTAAHFNVGEATVKRLVWLERTTGDVLPSVSHEGRNVKLDESWLASHVAEYPDMTRKERALAWEEEMGSSIHPSTISKGLRRIGWSYKKKDSRSTRTRARRRRRETP